jgi:hypothetical protein
MICFIRYQIAQYTADLRSANTFRQSMMAARSFLSHPQSPFDPCNQAMISLAHTVDRGKLLDAVRNLMNAMTEKFGMPCC